MDKLDFIVADPPCGAGGFLLGLFQSCGWFTLKSMKQKIDRALIVILATAYAIAIAVNFVPIYGLYVYAASLLWVMLQKGERPVSTPQD